MGRGPVVAVTRADWGTWRKRERGRVETLTIELDGGASIVLQVERHRAGDRWAATATQYDHALDLLGSCAWLGVHKTRRAAKRAARGAVRL